MSSQIGIHRSLPASCNNLEMNIIQIWEISDCLGRSCPTWSSCYGCTETQSGSLQTFVNISDRNDKELFQVTILQCTDRYLLLSCFEFLNWMCQLRGQQVCTRDQRPILLVDWILRPSSASNYSHAYLSVGRSRWPYLENERHRSWSAWLTLWP